MAELMTYFRKVQRSQSQSQNFSDNTSRTSSKSASTYRGQQVHVHRVVKVDIKLHRRDLIELVQVSLFNA